jgi:hypothetical protein
MSQSGSSRTQSRRKRHCPVVVLGDVQNLDISHHIDAVRIGKDDVHFLSFIHIISYLCAVHSIYQPRCWKRSGRSYWLGSYWSAPWLSTYCSSYIFSACSLAWRLAFSRSNQSSPLVSASCYCRQSEFRWIEYRSAHLVDFSGSEAGNELLGEGVGDGLALFALVVLEGLEASKGSTAGYELMAEAGLVLLEVVIVVDLLVRVLALICRTVSAFPSRSVSWTTYPRNPW